MIGSFGLNVNFSLSNKKNLFSLDKRRILSVWYDITVNFRYDKKAVRCSIRKALLNYLNT